MSIRDWAKNEIELTIKKENPNWDGKSFDYGIACYQSALKAFNSVLEDEHSGTSFGFTKSILIRLLNCHPLLPITEDDFPDTPYYENSYHCTRMSSLFKHVLETGEIQYSDVDRQYCIEVNDNRNTYNSKLCSDLIDELYPITLPYYPLSDKYKIYTDTFLFDAKNGDFDTRAILYIITPKGERVDINRYYYEKDNDWVDISKEEFEYRKENRAISCKDK